MRILTVRQPWAWAIIHGGKTVENRVRNIAGDYRGPVLIHAAKNTGTWNECEAALQAIHLIAGEDARAEFLRSPRGAIIGVVDLVDVHLGSQRPGHCWHDDRGMQKRCSVWGEDEAFHLVLANPRALTEPIPYQGALGLRRVDAETILAVTRQIGRVS